MAENFHMRGMIMHPAAEAVRQAGADARADLVRRIFGVAISIGFAATLSRMQWVQNGRLPEPDEFNQTLALLTALLATVLLGRPSLVDEVHAAVRFLALSHQYRAGLHLHVSFDGVGASGLRALDAGDHFFPARGLRRAHDPGGRRKLRSRARRRE